ncbi:hypothetical protein CI736_25350 [Shigella boydii]|nr:hypothetical protein [Escherichia coli]OYJ36500.1 hypothetical protein CI736_25350 [Shigella boydii]OYL31607.1 hypothetical protein CI769_10755 [Shigella sonnei]OYJ43568.1 hypothetical protein CI737_07760 [Escherichia coli]PAZ72617.1 hypothetical protein APX88_01790 [Escherichia coli]
MTNVKLPDALRLSGLLGELQYIEFARSCRPDKAFTELNPKTWTVSVNRLFDAQSGILPD